MNSGTRSSSVAALCTKSTRRGPYRLGTESVHILLGIECPRSRQERLSGSRRRRCCRGGRREYACSGSGRFSDRCSRDSSSYTSRSSSYA